jgi:hypothetical protein
MNDDINFFDGTEFDFLSNFHPCLVDYEGRRWTTTEHAYQAMKTYDVDQQRAIHKARDPGLAKMLGQRCIMRKDWDTVKYDIMLDLLRLKFRQPHFTGLLLKTGERKLIEGNTWNDTCWGVCNGVGANNLGRSLMLVRAELQRDVLAQKLLDYMEPTP